MKSKPNWSINAKRKGYPLCREPVPKADWPAYKLNGNLCGWCELRETRLARRQRFQEYQLLVLRTL